MAENGEHALFEKSLKRTYEEMHRAQYRNDYASAGGFERWVSYAIEQAKRLYPDNDIIRNLQPIGGIGYFGAINEGVQSPHLQYLKLRVADIADAIGLDLPSLEDVQSASQVLNINQIALQHVAQSIDNIVNVLNHANMQEDQKREATALIKDFEQESKKKSPDRRKLWRIVCSVGMIAKDIGYMLFQHGLDKGLFDWSILPT